MLRRRLIAEAATRAAGLLEGGFDPEARPENRLRSAFVRALELNPDVVEARSSPEWRPEMPYWPKNGGGQPGGFDLAVRLSGDTDYSLVAELKWSRHGYLDALDEVLWDALKLAHAVETLPGVTDGLLVYMAPMKAWAKPARFTNLFGDTLVSTPSLLVQHEKIWKWNLRGSSKSKPLKVPPYLQCGPVARVNLPVDDMPWEIRVARVFGNGEPWLDLDEEGMPMKETGQVVFDWPYPEPGPGMETDDPADSFRWPGKPRDTPSSALTATDVPSPDATWSEIEWFAAHYDGYARHDTDELARIANGAAAHFTAVGEIDPTLDIDGLRACLFFEHRRHRHFGHAPDTETTHYIRTLVEHLRSALQGR